MILYKWRLKRYIRKNVNILKKLDCEEFERGYVMKEMANAIAYHFKLDGLVALQMLIRELHKGEKNDGA